MLTCPHCHRPLQAPAAMQAWRQFHCPFCNALLEFTSNRYIFAQAGIPVPVDTQAIQDIVWTAVEENTKKINKSIKAIHWMIFFIFFSSLITAMFANHP